MDMSFADQALCARYVLEEKPKAPVVLNVPEAIDNEVARRKLKAVGVNIDELTDEQEKYLKSWRI